MSLINKMLQDLDARGTPAGEALPGQVKPVERAPRRPRVRVVAACVGGLAAGGALAWFMWSQYQYQHPHGAPRIMPLTMTVDAPVQPVAPAPAPAPAPAAAAVAQPAAAVSSSAVALQPAPAASAPVSAAPMQAVAPMAPDSAEARAARRARALELVARLDALDTAPAAASAPKPAPSPSRATPRAHAHDTHSAPSSPAAAAASPAAPTSAEASDEAAATPVRQGDVRQRAESQYRRALASMAEGRMIDTIAALEAALRVDPSHGAARQTLVGLLVEGGRQEEAMRQAQLGLTLDPRQPALAMLLARLQIERGGNGIDVLTRSLPYAGNSADYRAFLAAALERQGRHREAAEQYGAALQQSPSNGVWWMGLGLALQADKRNGEALDAFQKARAAGMPSPELQDFVERRVLQLGR